jgi:hypothetical protein
LPQRVAVAGNRTDRPILSFPAAAWGQERVSR